MANNKYSITCVHQSVLAAWKMTSEHLGGTAFFPIDCKKKFFQLLIWLLWSGISTAVTHD